MTGRVLMQKASRSGCRARPVLSPSRSISRAPACTATGWSCGMIPVAGWWRAVTSSIRFPPIGGCGGGTRAASLAAHAIPEPAASFRALLAAEGWVDQSVSCWRAICRPISCRTHRQRDPDWFRCRTGDGFSGNDRSRWPGLTRICATGTRPIRTGLGPGKAELLRAAGAVPPVDRGGDAGVLRTRGEVVRDGLAWRLPDHHPVLSPLDEAAWPRSDGPYRPRICGRPECANWRRRWAIAGGDGGVAATSRTVRAV